MRIVQHVVQSRSMLRSLRRLHRVEELLLDNHQIHEGTVEGPYPHGDRFILHFKYDVTPKHTGKRMTMDETGLYTAQNGKIVKEEFFNSM